MTVPFVLVPGNHDDLGELRAACADWPLAHLLHGQSFARDGAQLPAPRLIVCGELSLTDHNYSSVHVCDLPLHATC